MCRVASRANCCSICGGLHGASNDRTAGRMVGVSAKLFRKEVIEELATSTMTPPHGHATAHTLSAQHCATRHTPQRTRTYTHDQVHPYSLSLSLSLSLPCTVYCVCINQLSQRGQRAAAKPLPYVITRVETHIKTVSSKPHT